MEKFLAVQREIINNPDTPEAEDDQHWINLLQRPLRPLQDVKTRWDSTTQMCLRTRVLKRPLKVYLKHESVPRFLRIPDTEWTCIEYLIQLTAPFSAYTQTLGQSKTTTLYQTFPIYNKLFDHIEACKNRLRSKDLQWKRGLADSLGDAHEKLKKYYGLEHEEVNNLYAMALLLTPQQRNSAFRGWGMAENKNRTWRAHYRKIFRTKWEQHYKSTDLPSRQPQFNSQPDPTSLLFDAPNDPSTYVQSSNGGFKDEMDKYLDPDECKSFRGSLRGSQSNSISSSPSSHTSQLQ
jgi:hypothetical protein